VLALAGGALGALVAAGGVTLVKQLATIEAPGIFRLVFGATLLPRANEVTVNLKMFSIALSIATVSSLVIGALPAIHLSQAHWGLTLGARSGKAGRAAARLRAGLVVVQLVMATILLVSAGLLIQTFTRLTAVKTGYDSSRVLAFQLVFPADYSIPKKTDTIEAVLAHLRVIPGVESAGFSRAGILITEELVVGTFVPRGRTVDEMRAVPARPRVRSVSQGYLTTLGVRMREGRELEATDTATAPRVIVINRTMAQRFFGADHPVGQVVAWYPNAGPAIQVQIVGVVEDVRNTTPDRDAVPEVFVDYRQLLAVLQRWGNSTSQQTVTAIGFLSFAVRTIGDPASMIVSVSRGVRAVDPSVGIESMLPMDRLVASNVARPRFYAVMLSVFAGVAGGLAAIGIYGMLAYGVVQRTSEIGIRMALGAQRLQVLTLVLRQGLVLTTLGIALGLIGSAAATRLLQSLLFGVTPLDPTTFVAVSFGFGLVAMAGAYLPARRATRVSPLVALRFE